MSWQLFWQIMGLSAWAAFLLVAVAAAFKSPGGHK